MRDDDKTDLPGWLGLRKIPDVTKARWLGPLLTLGAVLVVGGLFLLALVTAFTLLSSAAFGSLLNDPRSALGVGGVTVALIGAPFVIWRSVVAQKTVTLQEQGHITDRINTAVQGLGAEKTVKLSGEDEKTAPNLEVRIGAIYALERIAQDSDRDHVQIMEILCAYIRQNAPAPAEDDWPKLEMKDGEDEGPLGDDWGVRLETFREKQDAAKATLKLREDIQTALTVIGRRSTKQRRFEAGRGLQAPVPFDIPCPNYNEAKEDHDYTALHVYRENLNTWLANLECYTGYRLDLRDADLRGADMSDAELKGALLIGTYLQGADLRRARLQGADLMDARLQGADLGLAQLQGAFLRTAQLQGADLGLAQLQVAFLGKARLQGAVLWHARLQGALLGDARAQGANLGEASLQGAHLRQMRLQGANLEMARLQGANLTRARLDKNTGVIKASFDGSAVKSVNLQMAPQFAAHVQDMFGDASVTLPGGHGPEHKSWPKHWPRFKLRRDFEKQWHEWQASPDGYTQPDPSKPAGPG